MGVESIRELGKKLGDGRAALIINEENRLYFTGFASSNGFLLITENACAFITDSRYIEAAREAVSGIDNCTVILQEKLLSQLSDVLHELDAKEVLIEASKLSVLDAARYKDALSDFELNYTDELDKHISALRRQKSAPEKEKLIRAQKIAEAAFEKVLHIIKPGITEREIAAEFEYNMRCGGADGASFDTISITGVNTSKPHGVPGDAPVASGDFVTLDFGAVYCGYHSDTTRTVAVGNVSPEMARVYDIVLRAQKAGVAGVRAGIAARDADALCRDIIEAEGFGDCFGHGTGHGVGAEIHEAPTLSPNSKEILAAGDVVTVEPGIYIAGKFGVRIEDMLFVTENGAENLVSLSKELIVLS